MIPVVSGIVTIDIRLTAETTCDARPVSRPYFAANRTVLFAGGTEAVSTRVESNAPVKPNALHSAIIIAGNTRSLRTATTGILQFLNIERKSECAMYVPNISIAKGVLRDAMYSPGLYAISGR